MKHLFRTILFLFTTIAWGQEHKNLVDKDFHGLSEGKHEGSLKQKSKNLNVTFFIKNGHLDGPMTTTTNKGKLVSIEMFKDGLFNGINYNYDKNGKVTIEEKYVNDTMIYYKDYDYYKNGNISASQETFFDPDSLEINTFPKAGPKNNDYSLRDLMKQIPCTTTFRMFYKSGKILSIWTARNGMDSGPHTTYYEDGKTWSISCFLNGKLDGAYKTHFENGQLKIECAYKNGILDGRYKEFDKKGILIKNYNYINGVKQKS